MAAKKSCTNPSTKKIGTKTYKKATTKALTKPQAKKKQAEIKSKKGLARVVKNPCGKGYHVYKHGGKK